MLMSSPVTGKLVRKQSSIFVEEFISALFSATLNMQLFKLLLTLLSADRSGFT